MPYQNLGSEIILAVGIWLLAIFTFIMMLLIVAVKLLSENWAKIKYRAKAERQTTGELPLQGSENIPAQDAELSSATLEQS